MVMVVAAAGASAAAFRKVDLYGGALTADLPSEFIDASTIRPVPDQQEIYLSPTNPTSVIFDILERAEPPDHPCATDEEALEYHYTDVVEAGHVRQEREQEESTTVLSEGKTDVVSLPDISAYTSVRLQTPLSLPPVAAAPSGGTQPAHTDFTGILITLIRLEAQKTDLLVTVNVPHVHGEYDKDGVDIHRGKTGLLMDEAEMVMERIRASLTVVDWDLFGE